MLLGLQVGEASAQPVRSSSREEWAQEARKLQLQGKDAASDSHKMTSCGTPTPASANLASMRGCWPLVMGWVSTHSWDARCPASLLAAVSEADIVSCATLATQPLLMGRWLRPGSHLDIIGSFTPAMREVDDDCFAGAALFVDTDEALAKSGDLLGPMAHGVFGTADVRGTMARLVSGQVSGQVSGRACAAQRTAFKSVGTALEDLAATMLVVRSANEVTNEIDAFVRQARRKPQP